MTGRPKNVSGPTRHCPVCQMASPCLVDWLRQGDRQETRYRARKTKIVRTQSQEGILLWFTLKSWWNRQHNFKMSTVEDWLVGIVGMVAGAAALHVFFFFSREPTMLKKTTRYHYEMFKVLLLTLSQLQVFWNVTISESAEKDLVVNS